MSTDIKLNKAQTSKIIQLSGSFGSLLANLDKKALTNLLFLYIEMISKQFNFKCNKYI